MENRCVYCGEIIPEGRMVCLMCEMQAEDREAGTAIVRPNEKKEC